VGRVSVEVFVYPAPTTMKMPSVAVMDVFASARDVSRVERRDGAVDRSSP
jgi:hypothetical protein